ncbi:MAG: guanylate kinase [Candidatus Melainabacteria bacterium]|nr:MAG: guanylate kinase [Candidatus Melainabacteria bacterium]
MVLKKQTQGKLLVITGPSGVGKGTLVQRLLAEVAGIKKSVSVTTRSARPHEVDGIDYFFKSTEQFMNMVKEHQFMEWAEFAGNLYGTPKQWVMEELGAGFDVILEIEVQGAKQIRQGHPQAVLIFLSPPSFEALKDRLEKRATEPPDKLAIRLAKAEQEMKEKSLFQYEVVNDNIDEAVNKLRDIVYSEREEKARGGNRLAK